jgi:hypothetical protein
MTASAAVQDFRPSEHGLHFANRFPSAPALWFPLGPLGSLPIGNAANGLCGGMSLLVRERFEARRPVPPDRAPPAPGSPLFDAIVRRQALSLDWFRVPLRFYSLQALRPERNDPFARLLRRRSRTSETVREWHRIRAVIDGGRLAPVGLIRVIGANPFALGRNHQVLAYGYIVEADRLTLRLYDPNHPDRDDVEIRLRLGVEGRGPATMLQTTGEPLFAFFLESSSAAG